MDLPDPFTEQDGQIGIDLPGARAIFTTRSWGDVRESHQQIAERLRVKMIRSKQVHGTNVITVSDNATAAALETEADAIITAAHGVAPTVITADCLPIAIAAPGAVAAVHAGWRGLDAGVIRSAVTKLRQLSGGGVLNAAIGPGAGACCYEVGDELHRRFKTHSQDFHRGPNLDLKAIARVQLMEAGVARIYDSEVCTICDDAQLTFSYRRDGAETGRQALVAWLS